MCLTQALQAGQMSNVRTFFDKLESGGKKKKRSNEFLQMDYKLKTMIPSEEDSMRCVLTLFFFLSSLLIVSVI